MTSSGSDRHTPRTLTKHRTRSMPIKRIQLNVCLSDAYYDGSAIIPTGFDRSDSINTALDRTAYERIRMEREQLSPGTVQKSETL